MKYFTLDELTRSDTARRRGIENVPEQEHIDNLVRLVENTLDPAREALDGSVKVNSGFRSKQLNAAVGGAPRSYHLQGRAADLTTGSREGNLRLYKILHRLPHVELIWEQGGKWVHVAL